MSPQALPPVMPPDNPAGTSAPAEGTSQPDERFVPELPNIDHLIFEDGNAVESLFAERQMRLFVEPLYASWEGPPESGKFVAMANVALFPDTRQTTLVPDGLLSTDVEVPGDPHLRLHHSYLVWVYGKPPVVVLELVSDRKGGELDHKLRHYARIGIAYYVVFDPRHFLGQQTLHTFRLEGLRYMPLAEARFPEVGLGLKLWQGVFEGVEAEWLRWHDRKGDLLATGEEQAKRARQAEERAEQERRQKDRLLTQLRALSITPDL